MDDEDDDFDLDLDADNDHAQGSDVEDLHDQRELELGLPERGGRARLKLARHLLLQQKSERERFSIDDHELIALFGSNRAENLGVVVRSSSEIELDELALFAAGGHDKVTLREKGSGGLEFMTVHGQSGHDWLDARRYRTAIELDGGKGRDVLIGGAAESELWGGPGADTFQLRAKGAGLQVLMDFDPQQDRLHFLFDTNNLRLQKQDDDLWLMKDEQALAVFAGFSDDRDLIRSLIS